MKILVIDDSRHDRHSIINVLENLGFEEITEAGDGEEALTLVDVKQFNFIITNWMMPGINGIELVRRLRKMQNYEDVPILMVSSRGSREDIMEAMKANINGYVTKPFTSDILFNKISSVLQDASKKKETRNLAQISGAKPAYSFLPFEVNFDLGRDENVESAAKILICSIKNKDKIIKNKRINLTSVFPGDKSKSKFSLLMADLDIDFNLKIEVELNIEFSLLNENDELVQRSVYSFKKSKA
ncbi:MAG: two-component system response regulator [Ignavibacteria bacterium]|nr:two-component system response regulator [Ignavibacteria bacterium]